MVQWFTNRPQSVFRQPVLIVTGLLCLVAALLGLWLGAEQAAISESDVINAAVARWSSETGRTDTSSCIARAPGEENVWLEVRCGMGDDRQIYRFDLRGRLLPQAGPQT